MTRKLTISLFANSYQIRGEVGLPLVSALYRDAVDGPFNALRMLDQVFGTCLVLEQPTYEEQEDFGVACAGDHRFRAKLSTARAVNGSLEFELTGSRPSRAVRIRLKRAPSSLANTFLQLSGDAVTVTAPDGQIRPRITPSDQAKDTMTWDASQQSFGSDALDLASVTFPETSSAAPSPDEADQGDSTGGSTISNQTQSIVEKIRALEMLPPREVQRALYILLAAIPFVWFVHILNRFAPAGSPEASTLRAVAMTFLVLHLTILALSVFEASIGQWAFGLAGDLIRDSEVRNKVQRILSGLNFTYPFLAIAVALLVQPIYRALLRSEPEAEGLGKKFLRGLLWLLLFWIVVIGAPAATAWVRYESLIRLQFAMTRLRNRNGCGHNGALATSPQHAALEKALHSRHNRV